MTSENSNKETIIASPLDYHMFRQEIISKYPAYVPPQPLIPLEAENTSLLPPLPHQSARNSAANGIIHRQAAAQSGGTSILHQPVHIATPAPSPPPSPGVGGKGVKKQNYQTNQNFPFMYPPLDATSNSAGGKGMAGIHEALVSRRWEGSDVPASILEAGELFSSRVRMTRATRQLWDERERFLKHERGWVVDDSDDEVEGLCLDELSLDDRDALEGLRAEGIRGKAPAAEQEVDLGPSPEQLSDRDKQRLAAVERFYVSTPLRKRGSVVLARLTRSHAARGPPPSAVAGDCAAAAHPRQRHGNSDAAVDAAARQLGGQGQQRGRQRRPCCTEDAGRRGPGGPSERAGAVAGGGGRGEDARDYVQGHDGHLAAPAEVAEGIS